MSHFVGFLAYLIWPVFIYISFQAVKYTLKKLKMM